MRQDSKRSKKRKRRSVSGGSGGEIETKDDVNMDGDKLKFSKGKGRKSKKEQKKAPAKKGPVIFYIAVCRTNEHVWQLR